MAKNDLPKGSVQRWFEPQILKKKRNLCKFGKFSKNFTSNFGLINRKIRAFDKK